MMRRAHFIFDIAELLKLRLSLMVVFSGAAGYYLAVPRINYTHFTISLIALFLVASGSMALNEYVEIELDSKMKRTQNRPLPAGRMKPVVGLLAGLTISVLGFAIFLAE